MVRHVFFALLVVLVAGRAALAKGPIQGTVEATRPPPALTVGADKTVQRLAPPLGCDRLTIAEGLPNSMVRAIVQDRRGFLWFGR